jgi:hypothetical protein
MSLEEELRATAVAHAIRLGKRPKAGMTMAGSVTLCQIDESDWNAGRLEKADMLEPKRRIEFVVSAQDIANAHHPKMTTLERK